MGQVAALAQVKPKSARHITVSTKLIGCGALLVTIGPFLTWSEVSFHGKHIQSPSALLLAGNIGWVLVTFGIVTLLSLLVPAARVRIAAALLSGGFVAASLYAASVTSSDPFVVTAGIGRWITAVGAALLVIGGLIGQRVPAKV